MSKVDLRLVEKSLFKIPLYIRIKAEQWAAAVEFLGIEEVRESPGFHDEPLQGKWIGFRSIRLNHSYRLIYKIQNDLIIVVEVNKHEY